MGRSCGVMPFRVCGRCPDSPWTCLFDADRFCFDVFQVETAGADEVVVDLTFFSPPPPPPPPPPQKKKKKKKKKKIIAV